MRQYPEEFKAKMVEKLARPGGPSASALAHETGVPQTTLSRWLSKAGRVNGLGDSKSKRPQDWTAQEKLQAVLEAEGLSEGVRDNPYSRPDARSMSWPASKSPNAGARKPASGRPPKRSISTRERTTPTTTNAPQHETASGDNYLDIYRELASQWKSFLLPSL